MAVLSQAAPPPIDVNSALFLCGIGAATLLVLWACGAFSHDVFRKVPERGIGLGWADLIVVIVIMMVGSILLVPIVNHLLTLDDHGQVVGSAVEQSLAALLSQGMTELPPVLYLLLRAWSRPGGLQRFGFISRRPLRDIAAGGVGVVVAILLVLGISGVVQLISSLTHHPMPQIEHELLKTLAKSHSPLGVLLMVLVAVVVAPVLEETIFRGFVQTLLLEKFGKRRRWAVIIIASAIFAAVHAGSVTWQAFPMLFVLALVLGWLYEKRGCLWPNMIVHAAFNAWNVALVLLMVHK